MPWQVQGQSRTVRIDQHGFLQVDAEQCKLPAIHVAALQQLLHLIVCVAVDVVAQVGQVGRQAQTGFLHRDGLLTDSRLSKVLLQVGLVGATQVQLTAVCGERGGCEGERLDLEALRGEWKVRHRCLHADDCGALYLNTGDLNVAAQGNGTLRGKCLVIGEILQRSL
ncbi:hypothetical protein D3C80_1609150 [compost metagenome]